MIKQKIKKSEFTSPTFNMLLTTSRDPSQKTRSFARILSEIFDWRYINRGKSPVEELLRLVRDRKETFAIINELKGNPAFIHFYDYRGRFIIGIRISVGVIKRLRKRVEGYILFSDEIKDFPMEIFEKVVVEKYAPKRFLRKSAPVIRVEVNNGGRELTFYYERDVILTLKVLEIIKKGEDLV